MDRMTIEKAIDILQKMPCKNNSEELEALNCAVACMKEIKIRDSRREKMKRIVEMFEERLDMILKDYGFTEADKPLLESFEECVIKPVCEKINQNIAWDKNASDLEKYRELGNPDNIRKRMDLLKLYQRVYGKNIEAEAVHND